MICYLQALQETCGEVCSKILRPIQFVSSFFFLSLTAILFLSLLIEKQVPSFIPAHLLKQDLCFDVLMFLILSVLTSSYIRRVGAWVISLQTKILSIRSTPPLLSCKGYGLTHWLFSTVLKYDIWIVFLQVFPLDYVAFCGLAFYIFYCSVSGLRSIGIRICMIKVNWKIDAKFITRHHRLVLYKLTMLLACLVF